MQTVEDRLLEDSVRGDIESEERFRKKAIKRYAEIVKLIKELEAEKEELKVDILDAIDDTPEHFINTPFGYFSAMERKSWEYSPKVLALETKLKEAKKNEEIKGIATIKSVSRYPVFSERKEK